MSNKPLTLIECHKAISKQAAKLDCMQRLLDQYRRNNSIYREQNYALRREVQQLFDANLGYLETMLARVDTIIDDAMKQDERSE